jgi:acyl carrier protein
MADVTIRDRLRQLLAKNVDVPESSLTETSTAQNTAGWDSVANLGFIADIEDEFGVTVTTNDAMRMKSLGDIAAFLEAAKQAR